ncbi:MAG TPA: DUF2752 domain-containing protein [Candidatus Angelobacter sp.]|nr:DUF2752 domain-containing protein [Candidatus Angelobacter sp.]
MILNRAFRPLGAWAVVVGAAVLHLFPPSRYSFYPRCPIYSATHILCPGCGATRALYELLHLNLRGALHYNALTTVLIPVAFIWWAVERSRASKHGRAMELRLPWIAWASLLLVAVLFTIARNTGLAFSI